MSAPLPTIITGTIVLDLRPTDPDDWQDRTATRALWDLTMAPTGAHVVLVVARGQYVDPQIGHVLRTQAAHLGVVTVQCDDAETIARWIKMLHATELTVATG